MKDPWAQFATRVIKDVMYLKRVSYKQLSDALQIIGIKESPTQLTNKINRGQFSAVLLFQCLKALEVKGLELNWGAMQEEDGGKPVMAVANVVTLGATRGHTHVTADYQVGTGRVVCNPRGYVGHGAVLDFEPTLVVEV